MPPQIVKQTMKTPVTTKSGTSSLTDRIMSVQDIQTGIKLCVYGRGKTGKTRLACTFPKPLIICGLEDGTKSVRASQGVDFIRILKSTEVDEVAKLVKAGKYKSVVLDTAGGLQDLILKEILNLEDIPIQRSWGMAKREDWMACGAQLKERLRCLLDLADNEGTNAIVIAHERNFKEEGGESDIMVPTVGAALTPAAAAWLNGACDYICQTFVREKETIKETNVNGTVIKSVVPAGPKDPKEYCLRVGPHPVYTTGFRLPEGVTLPNEIVNPNYASIMKLINGVK